MRRKATPLGLIAVFIAALLVTFWERDDRPSAPSGTPASAPAGPAASSPPIQGNDAPASAAPRTSATARSSDEQQAIAATRALIEKGGPFPNRQDGTVFQNREGRLPRQPRGYYREYTVPTRGAPTRGARRIVRGENGETYYTRDHYRTFERIDR